MWHAFHGVQTDKGCSKSMSTMVAIVAREGKSNKQTLLRGHKIAFMVNVRYLGCVRLCILVFMQLQIRITMVAKGVCIVCQCCHYRIANKEMTDNN